MAGARGHYWRLNDILIAQSRKVHAEVKRETSSGKAYI